MGNSQEVTMIKIVLSIIVLYVVVLLLFYCLQRSLIYFPSSYAAPTPQAAGVGQMQMVSLHTDDGLTLNAWYHPPKEPYKPTIVYFHGNAGHIGNRAIIIMPFLTKGYGVLLVTYRGYSGNPGKPSEKGFYQDARAALQFLKAKGVPLSSLVLYGESIGTAVAIQMATEYHIGALVLQAPFTSLTDIGQYHYPIFPIRWMLKDTFTCLEKAKNVHVPVLILHGENDNIIPPSMSRPLFEAFPGPKKALYIPNRGHNDLYEPLQVIQFIESHNI